MGARLSSTWTPFDRRYDFPPYEGPPQHSYLIASTQRSGSYFLGHLLHSSGQMGTPLEYLHPEHAPKWQKELDAPDLPTMIRKLFERRTSPNGWFGIKAHWDHLEFGLQSGLSSVLHFDRFIRIERRDRIAQAVSLAMARQTRSWLSMQEQKQEPRYSESDITRALTTLDRQSRNWDRWAVTSGVTPLQVYYEDLVADPLAVVNGILLEFGLNPMADLPNVPTRKQASSLNAEWQERYLRPSARARRQLKAAVKRVAGLG